MRNDIHSLIDHLPLTTVSKRLKLGKKLGIPPSKLREIESSALIELQQKDRQKIALRKMINYWFENNCKANYEGFLVILSSDEEYLPWDASTEQHYRPQELIGQCVPPTQQMKRTLKKVYPDFGCALQPMTPEEALDNCNPDKWSAISDWIKEHHTCTWYELIDELKKKGLDSGLLSKFLFEMMGKEHELLLPILQFASCYPCAVCARVMRLCPSTAILVNLAKFAKHVNVLAHAQ